MQKAERLLHAPSSFSALPSSIWTRLSVAVLSQFSHPAMHKSSRTLSDLRLYCRVLFQHLYLRPDFACASGAGVLFGAFSPRRCHTSP
jgi:hypothetical protein